MKNSELNIGRLPEFILSARDSLKGPFELDKSYD